MAGARQATGTELIMGKIAQLPAVTEAELDGTETVVIVKDDATKRTTFAAMILLALSVSCSTIVTTPFVAFALASMTA